MEPDALNPVDTGRENHEIERLIRALQSLLEGESAIDELVAIGPAAIPRLRDFLFSGRIASVPQPRMWAVEALARLDARDALIEYLQTPKRVADAQLAFAEDAVKNTAARRLGAWRDEVTFQALMEFCRRRTLVGVIESLAAFERAEAIPCFDRALEDGMCRIAAEEGLRRFGSRARSALVLSAVTPLPGAEDETPSSLVRRRSALALLTEIGVNEAGWVELRLLLDETDPQLVVRVAQLAASGGDESDRAIAASNLVAALPRIPWHAVKDAEEALLKLAPECRQTITDELTRRSANPPAARAGDEVFRLLARVDRRLREAP
jgi:hypothetical protein